MFPEHNKITRGFTIQRFITFPDGTMICQDQEFVAGEVDYENMDGETIEVDTSKEVYCPFNMEQPKQVGNDGLKFTCPKCQGTRLECVMDGSHESEVLNIDKDGDFDFGDVDGGDECDRFQCLHCGFTLKSDEKCSGGLSEYNITDHEEIVEWIKKHCKQDK
jgi:hypothetical protein